MPQNEAGTRIERLVSEPSAIGTSPPATALPEPPDEPPVMRVVRIARRAVVAVLAGEVVGEFAHVQRADENGAGGFEPGDQRRVRIRRRTLAVDLRTGQSRHSGDVDQVLDRKRHTGERPAGLGRGARPRTVGGDGGNAFNNGLRWAMRCRV